MLKTNILGSVIISLILLSLVGYAFYLGAKVDWSLYFKVAGVVIAIATVVGIASSGGVET